MLSTERAIVKVDFWRSISAIRPLVSVIENGHLSFLTIPGIFCLCSPGLYSWSLSLTPTSSRRQEPTSSDRHVAVSSCSSFPSPLIRRCRQWSTPERDCNSFARIATSFSAPFASLTYRNVRTKTASARVTRPAMLAAIESPSAMVDVVRRIGRYFARIVDRLLLIAF